MRVGALVKLVAIAVVSVVLAGCGSPVMSAVGDRNDVAGWAIVLLIDRDAANRAHAATALSGLHDPAALEPLTMAIADPAVPVRVAVVTATGQLGGSAQVVALLAAQDDPAPEVRDAATQAVTALVDRLEPTAAVGALTAALGDQRPPVHAAAESMLTRYVGNDANRAAGAVAALISAQADPDQPQPLRDAAAQGLPILLDQLPIVTAIAALFAAINQPATTTPAIAALQSYVPTVDRSAAAAAVVPLLGSQVDPAGTLPAREASGQALTALLTGMPDKEAARALLDALGNPAVHDAANAALRQYLAGLGPERAGPAIAAVYFLDDWLAVALGVAPDQLAAETRRRGLQLGPPGDISAAASVARDGTAVVSAHPYQPTDMYHPAVVLPADATPFVQTAQTRWAPTALRYLELVVVVENVNRTAQEIETCPYQPDRTGVPGSITRYRSTQTVRVVSAADGQPVAEQTFQGADPGPCLETEPFPLGQPHLDRFGDDPDLGQAVPWLESLIHPPAP